jgi:ABC-type Fe3+-citrate transport system substrate-binding protein
MFKWLKRKENGNTLEKHDELLLSKVRELTAKIEQLENKVQASTEYKINIHIEKFYAQKPVLEELTFKFDGINIKELSGSMNLGNNIGLHKSSQKPELTAQQKPEQNSRGDLGVSQTEAGYKIKM